MRWSVVFEAEGDRELTREEVVELRRCRRRPAPGSRRASAPPGTARSWSSRPTTRDDAIGSGGPSSPAPQPQRGCPAWPIVEVDATSEDDDFADLEDIVDVREPMIRLGSLAGYPFEGPRVLGGWTPPAEPAVYAVLYKPEPEAKPDRYAVIYVGHSEDLSTERFPFNHPRAACWVRRAGDRWKVYICTYEVPGGLPSHREQIAQELGAVYHPSCNEQQYDQAWDDNWIGEYSAPTTGPLTTGRDPGGSPPR